jgi:hypothetical protein
VFRGNEVNRAELVVAAEYVPGVTFVGLSDKW